METDGKPRAETGDYGGQEGGKPGQGEQQNAPREEAPPHAQGGQRKIETAPLEMLQEDAQDAFKQYEQHGWEMSLARQKERVQAVNIEMMMAICHLLTNLVNL